MKAATGSPGFGGQRRLKGNSMKAVKDGHRANTHKKPYPIPRSATFKAKKGGMPNNSTHGKVSKRHKNV